jgi:hypothetical protein
MKRRKFLQGTAAIAVAAPALTLAGLLGKIATEKSAYRMSDDGKTVEVTSKAAKTITLPRHDKTEFFINGEKIKEIIGVQMHTERPVRTFETITGRMHMVPEQETTRFTVEARWTPNLAKIRYDLEGQGPINVRFDFGNHSYRCQAMLNSLSIESDGTTPGPTSARITMFQTSELQTIERRTA